MLDYKTLFDRLPSGAMRCQITHDPPDCVFLEVNGAFARLNPAEIIGKRASVLIPSFLKGPTYAAYVRVAATGTPERLEGRGNMIANRWFQFAIDRTGTDEIIALVEDITERKTSELRLLAQYAVSRSLAGADRLSDAAADVLSPLGDSEGMDYGAMWLVAADGDTLDYVGDWLRAGVAADALVHATHTLQFRRGHGLAGKVLATGEHVVMDDITKETVLLRPDALIAAGITAARAFPILHGEKILGVVVAMWRSPPIPDVRRRELAISIGRQIGQFVARAQAKADLERLNAELERRVTERTAELEAFSYSVSHDLRAPLRAINGFSTILLEDHGAKLDAEALRLLETIRGRGAKMGSLIDDLLAFSRLGRAEVRRHGVDMEALAKTIVHEQAPAGQISVGALPRASGDVALLRQVWANLVSNALKYSRDRSPAIIEIGFADGAYFVRDNGVGFDMKYADKLFGVFQRLHREDEFEGTGVGLAIVRRIVERHGGRVWAKASLDKGATIFFTLEPDHG